MSSKQTAKTMRLTVYRDFDSEKLWLSSEINHGDWPFRFALKLEYPDTWDDEAEKLYGKYYVSILAISPEAAKQTDAYKSVVSQDWMEDIKARGASVQTVNLAEYEAMVDYGAYATLGQFHGNNLSKVLREARNKLREVDFLFGFAMDRAQNAIGATGWDFIKGDPTMRYQEVDNA